jgi:HK97 family phage major capsid protein
MDLSFLIAKREGLVVKANEILARAETDKRPLNADELTAHADAIAEVQGIDATIKARDAHVAAEVAAAVPAKAARSAQPGQVEQATEGRAVAAVGIHTPEYRAAFDRWVRGDNSAIPELRAHTIATDTAGGYLVPDVWYNKVITKLQEFTYMRGLATVIQTSRGELNIPRETSTGTAQWTTEGGAFNETEDVFGNVTLTPYKMTRIVRASEELLQDESFDFESYIAMTFGRAFGILEETGFINGSGTAQPTGVIRSSTTGTTATATNAITFDELYDLYFSVKPAYRANGTWLMNDSTRKELMKIKTGVASDKRYLYQSDLASAAEPTLFGRPVLSASDMPALATGTNVVAFGDFSYYYIADKPGISVQRLNELYAANGNVGFRAFRRTDGELILAEAVKHLRTA